MHDKRTIRSINFPYGMHAFLRQKTKEENSTTRKQINAAVSRHLPKVEELLNEAGFASVKSEDDRHMVRASIDVEIDDQLVGAADRLGVDLGALVLACLRREYGLRRGDALRDELLPTMKAAKAERDAKSASEKKDRE
jgi:hypothetical protein